MRALCLLCLVAGCAEFEPLNLGSCGNLILEAGEDCDSMDSKCIGCRVECEPNIAEPECRRGQVCGSDRTCRAPSGEFAPDPFIIPEEGAVWMAAGDFDGDGHADVVMQFNEPDLKVAFVDDTGVELVPLIEPIVVRGVVGDLTGDGVDDVFAAHERSEGETAEPNAVSFWRGLNGERSPELGYFATLTNVGAESRLLSATPAGDRVIELVAEDATKHWSSNRTVASDITPIGVGPGNLGTNVAIRDINGGECEDLDGSVFPRNEVALGFEGENEVRIASTCGGPSVFEFRPPVGLREKRRLGAAGVFFAAGSGDAIADLFVQDEGGGISVSYGVPDGSFHSSPAPPDGAGNGLFARTTIVSAERMAGALLVAVADFDLDGEVEVASATHYFPAPESCNTGGCDARAWDLPMHSAVVVDFNADGVPDLAGANEEGITIGLSAPASDEKFALHAIDVGGPADHLVAGDFNRDTVPDIAYIELDDEASSAADEAVVVVYGVPGQSADPEWETERLGPFVDIQDLVVEGGSTLVAHTLDEQGRPAGAFIRRGDPAQDFGMVARAPRIVNVHGSRSVAALVARPGDPNESIGHLALVGGSLSPHNILIGAELPVPLGAGARLLTAAIDLDRDGVDEFAIFGDGQGWVARLDVAAGRWNVAKEYAFVESFVSRPVHPDHTPRPGAGPGSVVAVGDVEGDGDLDVLVTTDEALPKVIVFRNDAGVLGGPIALAVPERPFFEFAAIQAWHKTPNLANRWLVAGEEGVSVADIDLEAREILIQNIDDQGRYVALATGDVNGDGLFDLAVATQTEVRILIAEESVGPLD